MGQLSKRKVVFVLGSGPSMLKLSDDVKRVLNECSETFAMNRFLMFHEVVGIVPRHLFLLDRGWPAPYVLQRSLEIADEKKLSIYFHLSDWYKSFFERKGFKAGKRSARFKEDLLKKFNWQLPRFDEPEKIEYFRYNSSSLFPFFMAESVDEEMYFYRGSLTTALNLINVKFPEHDICLLGVDLGSPDRFFFKEENEDPVLSNKMESRYEERRQLAQKNKVHGTAIEYNGTLGVPCKIPLIRDELNRRGVRLFVGTEDSLLVRDGLLPYQSIEALVEGQSVAEGLSGWSPESYKVDSTIIPTGFIPEPVLSKKKIPKGVRVGYAAKSMGGHYGVDLSALDVWAALRAAGLNPELITHTARKNLEHVEKKIVLPQAKSIPWLKFIPKDWREDWVISAYYRKLFRWQAAEGKPFDLMVINGLGSLSFFDKLNMQLGPRLLFVRESPRHFQFKKKAYNLETAKKSLSKVEATIFCSSLVRDEWLSMVELKNSYYVPNTAPEEKASVVKQLPRSVTRKKLGFAKNEFVIGCIASIQPRKGHDILLDQMGALVEVIPNLRVELIGTDFEPWALKLKNWIKRSPWRDRIHVVGKQDNPMEYIYGLDVMVLPARAEAMPRVILEAMVLETPVVSTCVDGIPEQVDHGKTGFLFPVHEPWVMVEQLKQFYLKKELRREMARAGAERYWNYFSNSQQQDSIQAVLAELLERFHR